MTTFLHAVHAEILKVRTTRMWWVLGLVMVAYLGSMAAGMGALFGWIAADPESAVSTGAAPLPPGVDLAALIYSMASSVGYVFPVVLGALAVTGEFRHQTLTPTFLATPHRGLVLAAKLVVLTLFGALLGVAAWLVTVGLGAPALAAFDVDTTLGDADTWTMVVRGVLAMALWAAIGVGLGALVPSQVASIVIVVAFTQFLEPLLRLAAAFTDLTAEIARFLPGAASDALVGASFYTVATPTGLGAEPLAWWQGGLVLLAMAVAAALGGYRSSWRKDVS